MPAPRIPGSERRILKKIDQYKNVREQVAAAALLGHQLQTAHLDAIFKHGQLLGSGTFGRVVEAMNTTTGEMVAIKLMDVRTEKSAYDKHWEMVKFELDMMTTLRHPNIVSFLGFQKTEQHFSIVMELVSGRSLAHVLHSVGAFHENVVRKFTHQLLQALEYLHSKNCVHRDIKGQNILLTTTGQVKLCDMGEARVRDLSNGGGRTKENRAFGSPAFSAPEQLMSQFFDEKIDIWAVGCVVIQMASGRDPWAETGYKEVPQLMFAVARGDMPAIPDNLSALGRAFVNRCLNKEPDRRPTATQLLEDPWLTGEENMPNASPTGGLCEAAEQQLKLLVETSASTVYHYFDPEADQYGARPADPNLRQGVLEMFPRSAASTVASDPQQRQDEDLSASGAENHMGSTVHYTPPGQAPSAFRQPGSGGAMLAVQQDQTSTSLNGSYQMPMELRTSNKGDSEPAPAPLYSPSAFSMPGMHRPSAGLGASGGFSVRYDFSEEGAMNMSMSSGVSEAVSSPGVANISADSTLSTSRHEGSLYGSRTFQYLPADSGEGSGSIQETNMADSTTAGESISQSLNSSVLSFIDCEEIRFGGNAPAKQVPWTSSKMSFDEFLAQKPGTSAFGPS